MNEGEKEFIVGWVERVTAIRKGRIVKLNHPKLGSTFLIDVTDRKDPTFLDNNLESQGKVISEIIYNYNRDDPRVNDSYAFENGVVVAITKRFDPEKGSRVYVGLQLIDPNDPDKDFTQRILHGIGMHAAGSGYVPFSQDSDPSHFHIREYMAKEIHDAIQEVGGIANLPPDFRNLGMLPSPGENG